MSGYGSYEYIKLLSFSHTILSCSFYHQKLLKKYGNIESTVLYYGLKTTDSKIHPPIYGKPIYIGTIGRNIDIKGFPYFFTLIKLLQEKFHIPAKGIIAGGKPHFEDLKLLRLFSLKEEVHFQELTHNLEPFWDKISIYVHTSLSETFGFSLLEAIHRGIPSFSFKSGGTEEIIGKNEGGILTEKKDIKKMAHLIHQAVRNIYFWEELSWRAKNRSQKFSWKTFKKNYLTILQK